MRKFRRDSESTQKRQYQPAGKANTQTIPLLLLPVALQNAAGAEPSPVTAARHWEEAILCTLVNRCRGKADTGKLGSQLYLRESPSDLGQKGPAEII